MIPSTYRAQYHGSHTIPAYMGQSMLLGGPQHAHGCTGWSALRRSSGGGTVKRHRAQNGRNVWVGDLPAPQGSKSVTVGMKSVRGCSALPGEQ